MSAVQSFAGMFEIDQHGRDRDIGDREGVADQKLAPAYRFFKIVEDRR